MITDVVSSLRTPSTRFIERDHLTANIVMMMISSLLYSGFEMWRGREGYSLFVLSVWRVKEDASGLARFVITRYMGKGSGRFISPKMTDTVRGGHLPASFDIIFTRKRFSYFEAQVQKRQINLMTCNVAQKTASVNENYLFFLFILSGTLYSLPLWRCNL